MSPPRHFRATEPRQPVDAVEHAESAHRDRSRVGRPPPAVEELPSSPKRTNTHEAVRDYHRAKEDGGGGGAAGGDGGGDGGGGKGAATTIPYVTSTTTCSCGCRRWAAR